MRRGVLGVVGLLLFGPALSAQGRGASASQEPDQRLTDLLRTADSLRGSARMVWPGFELPRYLLVSSPAAERVYIVGAATLADSFDWVDSAAALAVKRGPVPDSLARLNLRLRWNGEPLQAVVVPYALHDTLMLHFLMHESFHVYQSKQRLRGKGAFRLAPAPAFPSSDVDAVAVQILEGELLADALRARGDQRLALVRRALAAESLRCSLIGPSACNALRSLERIEGTADYVASILAGAGGHPSVRTINARQVMQARLRSVTVEQLEREYFYPLAGAWYMLAEDMNLVGWQAAAEVGFIRDILGVPAGQYGGDPRRDPLWPAALSRARRLLVMPDPK